MSVDPKFLKSVSSTIIAQSEVNTLQGIPGNEQNNNQTYVLYTLCDITDTSDKKGNYFTSVGLLGSATTTSNFGTGSTLFLTYPELMQLCVNQIVISPISSGAYSELIDGRSIAWNVPQTGSTAPFATLYSSTYGQLVRSQSSPLLGDNIAYLFSNSINTPYTGSTVNELGVLVNNAANTSWAGSNPNITGGVNLTRPAAVSWQDVQGNGIISAYGTDTRTGATYSVSVPGGYPDGRSGYNYDVPVGFAILDQGIFVITHSGITSNIPWTTSGYTQANAHPSGPPAGPNMSAYTNVYFTGTNGSNQISQILYTDVKTQFVQSAVCLALPQEFYISNNATWDRALALSQINGQSGVISIDPIYVTEIGLYNAFGELIAVAKTSQYVEKNYLNVITFNIDINF